jgi:hypothetical protein
MTVLKATLRLPEKLSQRIGRQLHQKCPAKPILYTVAQSEVPAEKLMATGRQLYKTESQVDRT